MKGCLRVAVIGFVCVGLFVALLAIVLDPNETRTATRNQSVVSPLLTAMPAPAVGQDVLVGEVRWKILSAESLGNTLISGNQFIDDLTTSGNFVKVRFEIENRSKDMKSFTGLDLIDNRDREYTRSSDAIRFIDNGEECVLENINPGITKICTAIYEVPFDATGLQAHVGDLSFWGSDEERIDLGL